MQKLYLITILLLLFSGLIAHQQEMHQFITREAFSLLKMSFPPDFTGFDEMEDYLGYDETEETSFNPNLFYSLGERKIVAGSWYEDEYDIVYHYGILREPNYNGLPEWVEEIVTGDFENNRAMHTTITHFWNVDGGEECSTYLDDTIYGDAGSYNWSFSIAGNAMKKFRKLAEGDYDMRLYYDNPIAWPQYDNCIINDFSVPSLVEMYHDQGEMTSFQYYHQLAQWYDCDSPTMNFADDIRVGLVYNLLGRMCHLLQDMTVPAHVHCTSHAGTYGMYSDHFEQNEMDYLYQHHYWSASEVYNEVGRFLDPYIYDDPLYYLMYTTAQITDFFADGRKNGDDSFDISIPGLLDYVSTLEGPQESSEINDESCRIIFDQVIPQAIRVTAGLMYWFAVETGQINPIPLPWSVSGCVELSDSEIVDDVVIKFINNEDGSTVQTYADENGNFSKTFYFEDTGIYEIIYQKEDYYPVHLEAVDISQELLLADAQLSPILDNGFVQVSRDPQYPGFYHIQDAVDYMQYQGDGVILIREGTYKGDKNKNIHWYPSSFSDPSNSVHLHLCAPSGHDVVIDCENSGCAFLFDEENLGMGFHYNNSDMIENIKIVNAEQGIVIRNGSPKIVNNVIENCHDYPYSYDTNGVGISCYSDAIIQGNEIRNCIGEWVGLNPEQSTLGGGIFVDNQSPGEVIIKDNIIENCSAGEGGAIYATGIGSFTIENNDIKNNTLICGEMSDDYPGEGTALYIADAFNVDIVNNLIAFNQKPEICGDNTIFIAAVDNVHFRNNTIAYNDEMKGLKSVNNDFVEILSSVFYENAMGVYCLDGSNTVVQYCCFYGNDEWSILGNASSKVTYFNNPDFEDPENGDFSPQWNVDRMSLLIDRGAHDYFDPDQTGSNIGCEDTFQHDHTLIDLSNNHNGNRYRWVSFPVLDREITAGATMASSVFSHYISIYQGYFDIQTKSSSNSWDGDWLYDDLELNSYDGYKVYSSSGAPVSVSGQKLDDNTPIQLGEGGRNWVGYFIEEPMSVDVALASIWDHVLSVASEDWYIEKDGAYPPERCCMIYGKMYDIKVDADCELIYLDGPEVEPKERIITEGFVYDEEKDYVPILVSGIDDPEVEEVGILLDGQCIGAAKVEEQPIQILAYPSDDLRGEGEIEFQFYSDGRGFKEVEKYSVYSEEEGTWISGSPHMNTYQMQQVNFGDIPDKPVNKLTQNYPNPFNPETKICYSIAEAGDIELSIFNLKGQKVITLVDEFQISGTYETIWNGLDEAGRKVTSGVYFYRIKSGNYESTKKMLLIK